MTVYVYTECPVCEYSAIYRADLRPARGGFLCFLCFEDCGHLQPVDIRPATAADVAEFDMRIKEPFP